MKSYSEYDLYSHNTMRLHCIAKEVLQPENEEELTELVSKFVRTRQKLHVLGAGSNIILPKRLKIPVLLLTSFNKAIKIENGIIEAGASVRVQTLIREAQKKSLGRIEYLFSVPCTVGGATVMNAGRGNGLRSIGKYVECVRCLNTHTRNIETISNDECHFGFRHSCFLNGDRIILTTILKLEHKEQHAIEHDIEARKLYAKEKLDDRRPSCGSIFNMSNGSIMRGIMGLRIGGAEWSSKTYNWLSNRGNAKNWQVRLLITVACLLHRISFKPFHLEVEIWNK